MLLQHEGYRVTSALGFIAAVENCKKGKFDLFILGHSIPDSDKQELIKIFRARCAAPVLALQRLGEKVPDGADHHVDPHDVNALLKAVGKIINDVGLT